jgi:methionine synthase II (cobalamin-independent)
VACIINAQESAGLDILTDGDARFDLAVGGKSWFFYVLERLGGIGGHRDYSSKWGFGLHPGHILWEVLEAYQPVVVTAKLTGARLEYSAVWQIAQRLTDKPVKFGTICVPSLVTLMQNEFYANDTELQEDLAAILNAELRAVASAGCEVIQLEEPAHHFAALDPKVTDNDLEQMTRVFNKQLIA